MPAEAVDKRFERLMIDRSKYEIVEGHLGPRLNLLAEWNDQIGAAVVGKRIDEIGVRFWPQQSIGFLREFPHLKGLQIGVKSVDPEPISCLEELEWIDLYNFTGKKIDFTRLQRLASCDLYWTPTNSTVLELKQLLRFRVDKFPKNKLASLGEFTRLEDLAILGCGATNLDALRSLKTLKHLRVNQFSRLESNDFVRELRDLTELRVEVTSGFTNLEPLGCLTNLEVLILNSVGAVESLRPIANLKNLRTLSISGRGTTLVDPNISYAWDLPNLERLSISGKYGVHWEAPSGLAF